MREAVGVCVTFGDLVVKGVPEVVGVKEGRAPEERVAVGSLLRVRVHDALAVIDGDSPTDFEAVGSLVMVDDAVWVAVEELVASGETDDVSVSGGDMDGFPVTVEVDVGEEDCVASEVGVPVAERVEVAEPVAVVLEVGDPV